MNSENGSGNSHVITRIISLSIKNFRGFPGEHKIDTNADLVLLSGPNGYGKKLHGGLFAAPYRLLLCRETRTAHK